MAAPCTKSCSLGFFMPTHQYVGSMRTLAAAFVSVVWAAGVGMPARAGVANGSKSPVAASRNFGNIMEKRALEWCWGQKYCFLTRCLVCNRFHAGKLNYEAKKARHRNRQRAFWVGEPQFASVAREGYYCCLASQSEALRCSLAWLAISVQPGYTVLPGLPVPSSAGDESAITTTRPVP